MALSTDILLGVPYNVGGTLREVDASTVVDNVFTFSSNGKKWQRVFDGGNSVYRASWLNITGAPTDKTALVAIAVANSAIQTLEIDITIQIDGAVDFSGKTLSVKSGGLVTGTYAISNAVIEGNLTQKILDPTGTITTSKSATGKWHPTWFGATADGVTNDYAAVNFAVGIANTNEQKSVSLIQGNYLLNTNLSIPSGVTLEFNKGAYVSGSSTISGAGEFDAQNSLAFGGTVIVSGLYSISGQVTPQMWGAVGDDNGTSGTNDSPAFQRMWDYVGSLTSGLIRVNIPSKNYYHPDTVNLPKTNVGADRFIKVEGYGAQIRTNTDAPIWSRHPLTGAESSTCINAYKCVIKGIRFLGNSTTVTGQTNQIALDLGSTYNWGIEECYFSRLYTACNLLFWLNGRVKNCMFLQNEYCDIMGRFGDWPGATSSNSAFNANLVEGCRFNSRSSTFTTVYLYAADQTTIRNCVSEGLNPLYNFYMDFDGNTGVLINTYENIWIESTGGANTQNTNFFLRCGGRIYLRNVQRIYPNRFFEIPTTSAATYQIVVDGLPWASNLPSTGLTFFSKDGSSTGSRKFIFTNINTVPSTFIEDPVNWDGGVVPVGLLIDTFTDVTNATYKIEKSSTSSQIAANSILLRKQTWGAAAWRGVYINPPSTANAAPFFGQRLLSCMDETASDLPTILAGSARHYIQYGSNNSANTGTQLSNMYVSTQNDNGRTVIFSGVRARGTLAALLAVINATILRIDRAEAYDGTGVVISGFTKWIVDGTPTTGIVPTSWEVDVMNTAGSIITPFKIRASGQIELSVAPTTGDISDGILTLTSGGALRQIPTSSIIGVGVINTLGYFDANGGAVKSLTAITASRALKSNASGLPVAFDTATEPSLTELSYVKGVTSSIQAQIGTKGLYAANGDGILTTFTVTHGFTGTPTNVQVTPAGVDSAIPLFVSNITGTTFDVTFTSAPIVGTNNVTFYWTAK